MVCIYCGAQTGVINSRPQKRQNHIWRRRQCAGCAAVFTTSESPDLVKSLSVRTGKKLQPFSRDLLFLTIHDSLKHRKTATGDATALTDTIISQLYPHVKAGLVRQEDVVATSVKILKRFDKAAATHYVAYHPLRIETVA